MRRREACYARRDKRAEKRLTELDFLLGVYDGQRMGALRFQEGERDCFLNSDERLATPPWTSLRNLELADFIMRHGAAPEADLAELWRRIVFNICVSNTDDHLRNHGFMLAAKDGWTLSPAYDMNPNPQGDGLTLNITENDNRLDLDLSLEVAESFHLEATRAKEIMGAVRQAVKQWRHVATRHKLSKAEQERMSLSFQRA